MSANEKLYIIYELIRMVPITLGCARSKSRFGTIADKMVCNTGTNSVNMSSMLLVMLWGCQFLSDSCNVKGFDWDSN